ncbi:hypothetical protein ATCC90586_009419 [Pythium insidiosum]|nr:hypothetical protein ATCC90586_009419 [Pythium insidiosum]
MGALQRRELAMSWKPGARELLPAFYAARMATASLRSVALPLDTTRDRFTTMDVHATASIVAVGLGTGQLRTYSIGRADTLALQSSTPESGYCVSHLRLHPRHGSALLHCAIGAGSSSGVVQLYHDAAALDAQEVSAWAVVDPWVAEWSPTDRSKFSIGCAANGPRRQSGAALVEASSESLVFAPRPPTASDVLSQSFSRNSPWVLNGTRSGGLWLWDPRSPVVELSWRPQKRDKDGSVTSLHVLSDDRQAVVQRSNGALGVVDLRASSSLSSSSSSWSVVSALSAGRPDQFSRTLRCHVSSDESAVVAPSSHCAQVFALSSGRLLGTVHAADPMRSPFLEQALLQDTTIWVMGRHDVLTASMSATR